MQPQAVSSPPPITGWIKFLLVGILLCAWAVRFQGIDWPRFHPDEPTIAGWIEDSADDGVIRHHGYPAGFFNLLRPIRATVLTGQELMHRWAFWQGSLDVRQDPKVDNLLLARHFNAFLGGLVVLVVFLLARRISASNAAALCAAVLMGFAPHQVEHGHYAETDMALMFTYSLALLAWARALPRPSLGSLALASLITGVAIGTKYTIVFILILPLFALALRVDRTRPWASVGRYGAELLLCLGLILAGFLWANPGALEVDWFLNQLQSGARRTFGERVSLLGADRHVWWVPILNNLRVVGLDMKTLGPGWALLAAGGLAMTLRPAYRRFALITLGIPLILLVYLAFFAPWVRAQENMPFYPILCVLAALPVATVLRHTGPRARSLRWLTAGLAVWAMVSTVQAGARFGLLFQWREPRLVAGTWLARHLPVDRTVGFERYLQHAIYGYPGPVADAFKVERFGWDRLKGLGCDYLLRNVYFHGRGTLDPKTSRRRPEYQARFDDFMQRARPVMAWGPLPPHYATFAGQVVELYAMSGTASTHRVDHAVPQPAYLDSSMRATTQNVKPGLGSDTALLVDRRPRTLAFAGPAAVTSSVWMVLTTEDRGARIHVKGFGRHTTVELAAYDLAIVELKRPWWRPGWNTYETVRLWAETKRDVVFLPCYARAAHRPEDVMRMALDHGRADRALAALGEQALRQSSHPWLAWQVAAAASHPALARELAGPAAAVIEQVQAHPDAALDGWDPDLYADCARIRLADITPVPLLSTPRTNLPSADQDWRTTRTAEHAWTCPFYLPAGTYTLSMRVKVRPAEKSTQPVAGTLVIRDLAGQHLLEVSAPDFIAEGGRLDLVFTNDFPRQPVLQFETEVPNRIFLSEVELRWNRADLLTRERDPRHPEPDAPPAGWVFPPFVALQAERDEGGRLHGAATVTREGCPPLEVVLVKRNQKKWRVVASQPLGENLFPGAGERTGFSFEVPPDAKLQDWALGLRPRVRWHAGWLRSDQVEAPQIPLTQMR